MTKLLDLPAELLINVASHLTTDDLLGTSALLNLCLSSRMLRHASQPALHSVVRLPTWIEGPFKSYQRFLRTTYKRPDLAKAVREISIGTAYGDYAALAELVSDERLPGLFTPIQEKLNKWDGALASGFDYLVAGILARLPNLERLCLTARWKHPQELLSFIHHLQAEGGVLPKLKSFHLQKEYEDGPVNLQDYVPFFEHPTFQELTTKNDVPDWVGEFPAINSISRSEFESYWSTMDAQSLRNLLCSCPSLKMACFCIPEPLRYSVSVDTVLSFQFRPKDFVQALLDTHGSTLQLIHGDFQHSYSLRDPQFLQVTNAEELQIPRSDWMYPSFRGFENLTRMTIEFERLSRVSDLPASLELLCLTRCFFSDVEDQCLSDLLRMKESWCPNIRDVIIRGEERTNVGIIIVANRATKLNKRFSCSEDRRVLTFSGMGFVLQFQSEAPQFLSTSGSGVSEEERREEEVVEEEEEEEEGEGDESEIEH